MVDDAVRHWAFLAFTAAVTGDPEIKRELEDWERDHPEEIMAFVDSEEGEA